MFHPILMTAVVSVLALTWEPMANAAPAFDAYAGPSVWGPSYQLPGHLGAVTYTVSYQVLGKTSVAGEVTYVNEVGRTVSRTFSGSITFRTGKFAGQPTVKFRGIPTGSALRVTVSP